MRTTIMRTTIATVILECVFDLGIAVVYAMIAGLVIAGVVASDGGLGTLPAALLTASLLPAGIVLLIAGDLGARLFKEWRGARGPHPRSTR